MSGFQRVALYGAFAVLAIGVNLGVQRGVIAVGEAVAVPSSAAFLAALVSGTAAGLLIKYLLDKKWIFADTSTGLAAHSRKFSLYTAMGLATTALFWGMESAFWFAWRTQGARELGAILGLTIGYMVKYQLDRRYVFIDTAERAP